MRFSVRIFMAELLGTFGLVIAATGSIVYDDIHSQNLGLGFISLMHLLGLWIVVSVFGKYSMAHFNPAVTIGFAITRHARWSDVPTYLVAQCVGGMLGSVFVLYTLGHHADLGLNRPDYSLGLPFFFGAEVLATIFLMVGILCIVSTKVHGIVTGLVVGSIVAFDVWFLGPVSGASMNPIRSLAPVVMTGIIHDVWLYITAPLLGVLMPALLYRWRMNLQRSN
ncbi:MAG: hypothetical protein F4Y82_06385 [Cenarchaeum sp. SB0665_bin_23]|nr:hypothetical protein [Cenarchaeum sp. SB0667_bin_13]MXY61719.1 hypothetical protein [Cenarchaeum sp. SB0665_bin_23]MXZ93067.1 hypothetical protein [Cenarchaeum sp. SB0666_bin_15]MYB46206.1 hypothetical protein [Cenarchaeum sp. SB0662_bin_33]MYC79230.1 hypothetical protein [Cenarchaeum sp. SB0661_bin_35]MYD58333.1 hypothetical protein [Cenarchaeum sp. SB0678_bin_8]MYG33496.1 hypothetical protein [Cenarchaeum sp. SB0677_bin_16]MYJ27661.1 hypothetical protein [Cenarchaeum sp. SB0672_bin_9]